ncbi:MAG: AAA family ATPase, partial [Deltaproteobacteria bacterium]|nr:AAA family ATPase [Deltaproteobacteria bacterium]
MSIRLLGPHEAYHYCDPESFAFETTAEIDGVTRFIGQERALEAVGFGIGIRHQGFNLF